MLGAGLSPQVGEGRSVLAHELVHVVQQRRGPVDGTPLVNGITVSAPGDHFEREAEEVARRALAGSARPAARAPREPSPQARGGVRQVQRQTPAGPQLNPAQQAAIQSLQVDAVVSAWPQLPWKANDPDPLTMTPGGQTVFKGVAAGAIDRILRPADIDQTSLNVCGPAAVLNMEAERNPRRYASEVGTIYAEGKAQGKRVNDQLLHNAPPAGMSSVDWMMASAIRDAENKVLKFHGRPDEALSAMTTPWEEEGMMEKDLGCVETAHYPCSIVTGGLWSVHHQTMKVNKLLAAHPDDIVVAMLVNADRMQGNKKGINLPDHWVRLLSPVVYDGDDKVTAKIFTWGSTQTLTYPKNGTNFSNVVFSYVVGAFKKGLL